jgi:hypothetical protein
MEYSCLGLTVQCKYAILLMPKGNKNILEDFINGKQTRYRCNSC